MGRETSPLIKGGDFMKFGMGDKFYIFVLHSLHNGFEVTEYSVTEILIRRNNVTMYKYSDTRWFDEKECLTKDEVIEKVRFQIEKIRAGRR